jgi:hypothetical protein
MSEATRQWRLYIDNRLQELQAKYGPSEQHELPSLDCDPSWGSVGSILDSHLGPLEYDHLRVLHYQLVALERMRATQPAASDRQVPEPPPEFEATRIDLV